MLLPKFGTNSFVDGSAGVLLGGGADQLVGRGYKAIIAERSATLFSSREKVLKADIDAPPDLRIY